MEGLNSRIMVNKGRGEGFVNPKTHENRAADVAPRMMDI